MAVALSREVARLARRRTPVRNVAILLFVLPFACAGCLRAITDAPVDTVLEQSDEPDHAQVTTDKPPSLEELERALTTKVTRRDPTTKATTTDVVDGWYRDLADANAWTTKPGEYRWRHDGLAALLKDQGDDRGALREVLPSKDTLVRAAAVIGLARLEPQRYDNELVALARNTNLPASVRRAAIETLAAAPVLETEAELRKLVDRFGPNDEGVCREPLLFAETLAGLARHVAVDQDPLFTSALAVDDVEVQIAVLSMYGSATSPQLPEEVQSLTKSTNARVRRAALAALVAGGDAGACEALRDATKDADVSVRLGAIELLGKVEDREAILLLYDLLNDGHERHREAAATALVTQQEWPAIERAARDPSYRVRVAVAAAIAAHGSATGMPLATELVRDSSAMVQAKMCESLAGWPKEWAVPILLEALASRNMLTRQAALAALTKQGVDCEAYNPGAPPAERTPALAAIKERWQNEHPLASVEISVAAAADNLSRDEVERLVKQLQSRGDRSAQWIARKQLERLGKPVVSVIDQLVREERITLEESTFRELLAPLHPAFAALEQLRSPDVAQRRTAARTLAHEATLEPLPRIALARIGHIARTESDALVWGDLLRAAAQTTDHIEHEFALAALAQDEADVRRRACEYVAACGDKRQSEAVAALLADRDPVVAKSALAALGRTGPPRSRQPVYDRLQHPDAQVQVTAATSIARWNDPRGSAALKRLALDTSPAIRRLAIAAMGELADLQYTEAVLQALDDQPSVQLAALTALPKVTGKDALADRQPPPVSASERARAWKEWHAQQR